MLVNSWTQHSSIFLPLPPRSRPWSVALASLPPAIASNEQVIAALAAYSVNPHGDGVVVCGSPGEVGSDWNLGGIDGFDVKMPHSNGGWTLYNREIYKDWTFMKQK